MYKVYAKADETGRIVSVDSDVFLPDTDGWTLLTSISLLIYKEGL